jgi:hypothetical protein
MRAPVLRWRSRLRLSVLAAQVKQQGWGAATLSHEVLAFVCLAALFAVSAAHSERKRSQASFRNLGSALETVAVAAFIKSTERSVNLLQHLYSQLHQRESDLVLSVELGALGVVEHIAIGDSVAPGCANSVSKLMHKFDAPTFEVRPELLEAACLRQGLDRCREHVACAPSLNVPQ